MVLNFHLFFFFYIFKKLKKKIRIRYLEFEWNNIDFERKFKRLENIFINLNKSNHLIRKFRKITTQIKINRNDKKT